MNRSVVMRYLVPLLVALALVRVGLVFVSGFSFGRGDYYATLPGAYAETINPTLWNSPDLENIQGRLPGYLRGPAQYLTLYPLVYLDSYEEIGTFLLMVYGLLVLVIAEVSFRVFQRAHGAPIPRAPVFIATLFYFPLLQAWVGREFEVVIALAFLFALWAAVSDRRGLLGGIVAYIALYKYIPIIAVPYLLMRRWWVSLAGFAAVAIVMLAAAHWLFGLENFLNNHIPGMASGQITSLASTKAFCDGPIPLLQYRETGVGVSLRAGLCSLSRSVPFPPAPVYILIVLGTIGAAAYGTVRLERARNTLSPRTERWRRVWEISLIAFVSSTFFYAHYYYLSILILPVNALLVCLTEDKSRPRLALAMWALAYVLLAAFLLPPSFLTRRLGVDVWKLYFSSLAYFTGELLLLGLVLHQYLTLPLGSAKDRPSPA